MLSTELKKDVRRLWDAFWAGGIANPLTAIEQITYLVYLKQLEDRNKDGAFFSGPNGNAFRWSVVRQLPNEEALRHLKTKVFPRLRTMQAEDDAQMSGAELLINSPNLLGTAITIIDNIFVTSRNHDALGDIYEELLREIAVAGKNGQFRTPRHIIRLMCDLVDPHVGERVCDPACGTGGFLINAFQHMLKRNQSSDNIEFEADGTPVRLVYDQLDDADYQRLCEGDAFVGYDFDQTMVRLGWMNLTLHDMRTPQIRYHNTLGAAFNAYLNSPDFVPFDVVLANPPFTGNIDIGDIGESLKSELSTNKTELLFVELIFQLLAEDGRAAVILPEGVLFGSTNAHKALRHKLLSQTRIKAIISLPGGVFQPYTSVKTSILIFQKGGSTDKVWFYELAHDGQTLDSKRTERPEYNDSWDLTARYALRYHPTPPAFINPQSVHAWNQWRALSYKERRESYVLPLFVQHDRLDFDTDTSIYPTTLRHAYERYEELCATEAQILFMVDERKEAIRQSARIRALMTLHGRGKGDRQRAAQEAAQRYLRDGLRGVSAMFERAAEGVLHTTGDERHGLDALMAAVNEGLGDTAAWSATVLGDIMSELPSSTSAPANARETLADLEATTHYGLAALVVGHSVVDGRVVVRYTPAKTGGSHGKEVHRDLDRG